MFIKNWEEPIMTDTSEAGDKMTVIVSVYDLTMLVENLNNLTECVKNQKEQIDKLRTDIDKLKNDKRGKSCFHLMLKFFNR